MQTASKPMPADIHEWVVVLVDDHEDNIVVARTALEFYGATVHTALDGAEGLELIAAVQPNLILLDLSMPIMDGWEMFRRVRERPELAEVPVVALTAHAMDGDRERVLKAGFDGYIAKPFNVVGFVGDIRSALSSSAVR